MQGDGLPQEVCGVCHHQLDLSVIFRRQVHKADNMLREHLASTQENERCATPVITGDPLCEEAAQGKEQQQKKKGEVEKEKEVEVNNKTFNGNRSGDRLDNSVQIKEEPDWAMAEPWPERLGESETVMEEDTVDDSLATDTENVEVKKEDSHLKSDRVKFENEEESCLSDGNGPEDDDDTSSEELDLKKFPVKLSLTLSDDSDDSELSCDVCQEKFKTISRLRKHRAEHEDQDSIERFKCSHCPKDFLSEKGLHAHQREHKKKPKRSRRSDRNRPRSRKKKCNKAKRSVPIKSNESRKPLEYLKNHPNPEKKVKEQCKIAQNEEQNHVGEEQAPSDEQKEGLRRSSRSTLGKAPERHVVPHYSCSKCEKMYNDRDTLENHERMHHGMMYKCNHCGKKFQHKDSLEKHIRNVHLITNSSGTSVKKCRIQPKRNREQSKINHNQPRRSRHECNICGKSYENRSHLFSHMRSHKSTVHLCEICGKTVSLNTYPAHKRSHQNAESQEIFPCELCGKKFNNKVSLRTHKNSYHGTLKFTCEVCGKQFTTMALMRHHQNVHSGKRDHICQLCGRAFMLRVTLKSHMRIHTGEMPYGCENCGRHFTWKTTYRNHITTCKKVQTEVTSKSEVVKQSRMRVIPAPAPPPPTPVTVSFIPHHLPQELPLDYSEEAKCEAPIDYSEEGKYRFLPISIPDSKNYPSVLNFKEEIKYTYQQPLNFSGDVKFTVNVKSPT